MLTHYLQNQQSFLNQRVLGVMTGTSLDGVDLCLCRFIDSHKHNNNNITSFMKIEKFATLPYPKELLSVLQELLQSGGANHSSITTPSYLLHLICKANTLWSREIGKMINEFLRKEENNNNNALSPIVIASHGQTIWHISGDSTLQIGDTEVLAHVTERIVIGNFRAADVANGGTGAPLVPFLDRFLAADAMKRHVQEQQQQNQKGSSSGLVLLQNLGGIGNTSVVYVDGEGRQEILVAFDTGPANVILNELVMSLTNEKDGLVAKVLKKLIAPKEEEETNEATKENESSWIEVLKKLFKVSEIPLSFDKDSFYSSRGKTVVAEPLESSVTSEYFEVLFAKKQEKKKPEMKSPKHSLERIKELRTILRRELQGRTTGREDFGPSFTSSVYLKNCFDFLHNNSKMDDDQKQKCYFESPESFIQYFCDLCATASLFTAKAIAMHLEVVERCWNSFVGTNDDQKDNSSNNINNNIMLCSGGGSCNPDLMRNIEKETSFFVHKVAKLSEFVQFRKVDGSNFEELDDAKEAIAFALLGREKLVSMMETRSSEGSLLDQDGTNEPCATGASKKCFLGQISVPN